MSKTAQQVIILFAVLLLFAVGWGAFGWMQKAQLETSNATLLKQVDDFGAKEKNYILENNSLKAKVQEVEKAKAELEKSLAKFKDVDLDKLNAQVKDITSERDDLKKRFDTVTQEREKLVAKLSQVEKDLDAFKGKAAESAAAQPAPAPSAPAPSASTETAAAGPSSENSRSQDASAQQQQDEYWAKVLKEKADLQLKVENLGATLNATNVELVELKKKNSDIQLALSELKNEKDAIEREIKHGKDLADTLSLELARAQNEKKFLNDRVEKLLGENSTLREQIKQLSSTKIALEKSIVRLQDDKKETEKKLAETENVIQSRIDQIWSIKESLDKDFKNPKTRESGQVELPPIVVSPQASAEGRGANAAPGFHGNVVSLNQDNNFVIVDIGEGDGLRVGDSLSVYRGTEYIAGLEVIQLRKDIAAADIKEKVADVQVGDVVR